MPQNSENDYHFRNNPFNNQTPSLKINYWYVSTVFHSRLLYFLQYNRSLNAFSTKLEQKRRGKTSSYSKSTRAIRRNANRKLNLNLNHGKLESETNFRRRVIKRLQEIQTTGTIILPEEPYFINFLCYDVLYARGLEKPELADSDVPGEPQKYIIRDV
ncbi:unnamed protein product [Ambrosiozyma monospora]|uniref:Unnamed protein product n=1 Tax=Ambrosiozyma monospora TaxID=43982 RepID=A0ACB5SWT1_AMBMO|nr:unnamed protein product [Ambrosiozyma monospora]